MVSAFVTFAVTVNAAGQGDVTLVAVHIHEAAGDGVFGLAEQTKWNPLKRGLWAGQSAPDAARDYPHAKCGFG